jgi:hypothetical protein
MRARLSPIIIFTALIPFLSTGAMAEVQPFDLKGVRIGMLKSEIPVALGQCGDWSSQTTWCRWAAGVTFGGFPLARQKRNDDVLFRKGRVIEVNFRINKSNDDAIEAALVSNFGPCAPYKIPKYTPLNPDQMKGCRNGSWSNGRGERIDYEVWTGGMKVDLTYDVNKDLRGSKPPTREKPAATDI